MGHHMTTDNGKQQEHNRQGGIRYDAFISYRHAELDSFVAQTLHKQLESFKLPKNVARRKQAEHKEPADAKAVATVQAGSREADMTESVKTRIERVFRDKEELPLVTNLADPITEALQNSAYLIVICSPRLPESMWCRKEIETFIEMHDREHVLAVLAEGEPDTSFPEELLYREAKEYEPDGSVVKRRIPVEPLAADVRGANRREIRRKIKSELLRLAAPMFDCNYDDLRQRHKEQRNRRILMTSMSVSAVCLSFGVISTAMALQIRRQNTQIKEQNTQIRGQAAAIASQAQEIEQQYWEAKRATAISRAKEAVGYLEEGDRMRAVATAQDALLELSETGRIEAETDYPAEAVYALTDSLYLYENGQQILPDRLLAADTTIGIMKLSPAGSRLLTVDAAGQAVLWNPSDLTEQVVINGAQDANYAEQEIAFLGEDHVFCPVDDAVVLYHVTADGAEPVYQIPCEAYVGIIVLQEQKRAIVLSESGYRAVDCTDGSLLYEKDWELDGLAARATVEYAVSGDGSYFAVSLQAPYIEDRERQIRQLAAVYSTGTGERANAYPIAYEYIRALRFDGDWLYVVSNHSGGTDFTRVTLGMESRLQAFAINGADTPVWTYERANGWLYGMSFGSEANSNYLLCNGYSDVTVLDKRDGSYMDQFGLGVEVVRLGNYSGSDNFMAFTRDGVWHYLSMERMEDMVGMLFPACTSANVKDFAIGDGYCVTLPYNSRNVTVYRTARGEGLEEVCQADGSYREAVLSSDGSYLAAAVYDDDYHTVVEAYDTATGGRLWRYENDAYYEGMTFVDYDGQEALALLTREAVVVLEAAQGTQLTAGQLGRAGGFDYLGCGGGEQSPRYFYLWDDETLYGYDIANMEYAYEIPHERRIAYDDAVAVAGDPECCYAVTDKAAGAIHFYRMGEEIATYDEEAARQEGRAGAAAADAINVKYIETIFFDRWETGGHLYVVYMDGRITRMDIDAEADTVTPCTCGGEAAAYSGLGEVMRGYVHRDGDDYAVLQGTSDAYLIRADAGEDGSTGDLLAHLHGFLCYDSIHRQVYLTYNHAIYRTPLYTLAEIDEMAAKVRRDGEMP